MKKVPQEPNNLDPEQQAVHFRNKVYGQNLTRDGYPRTGYDFASVFRRIDGVSKDQDTIDKLSGADLSDLACEKKPPVSLNDLKCMMREFIKNNRKFVCAYAEYLRSKIEKFQPDVDKVETLLKRRIVIANAYGDFEDMFNLELQHAKNPLLDAWLSEKKLMPFYGLLQAALNPEDDFFVGDPHLSARLQTSCGSLKAIVEAVQEHAIQQIPR